MEKGVKKSVHDLASLHVRTKLPGVNRERNKEVVEGIDQRIKRLRKEKAFSFIKSQL